MIARPLGYELSAVVGPLLPWPLFGAMRPAPHRIDLVLPVKGGVNISDRCRADLGRLTQGKSDIDAAQNFRGDSRF